MQQQWLRKTSAVCVDDDFMFFLFCLISFSEKERDVVIAMIMIDIIPYKDLIVNNKSNVIRYRGQKKQNQSGNVRCRLAGPRRINIKHNVQSQYIT